MKKVLIGAVAAATLATGIATPAMAQYRDYRYDRRDRGIDAGDVITGVAVIGGIAAILGALDRDGGQYGYNNRYRYRNDYTAAVNSCAYEAERISGGRVQITDVDRTGNNSYRVRGVVDAGYGYDRYSNSRFGRDGREDFTCRARANGRITDFNL